MTHFAEKGAINAKSAKEQRRHDKWAAKQRKAAKHGKKS